MEVIQARLKRAIEEAEGIEKYDYLIINDDLEECVERFHSIVTNEHERVSRNEENIANMRSQLAAFAKN